jgi:hypothetical protein
MLDQNILQPYSNPAAPGPADPNHPDVHKINLDTAFVDNFSFHHFTTF